MSRCGEEGVCGLVVWWSVLWSRNLGPGGWKLSRLESARVCVEIIYVCVSPRLIGCVYAFGVLCKLLCA